MYFVVTEYLPTNLFEYINESGALDEGMARFFFIQMLNAVQYCHSKEVAHRDLKPENMMLDDQMNVKIIDFGFARTT